MADFKIKPSAGTGNKMLIQSQDQSSSAYAIQVGDAGATTLTNATITAGTFPAGHVIKVETNVITSSSATTTSTTPVRLTTHGHTITDVASGNDVWIIMTCLCRLDSTTNSGAMGTGVNLYRESTEIRSTEGYTWYHNNNNSAAKTYLDTITINHLDTSPAVGTNNYYIGHEVYDAGHYSTITNEAPFVMTLMEIQR